MKLRRFWANRLRVARSAAHSSMSGSQSCIPKSRVEKSSWRSMTFAPRPAASRTSRSAFARFSFSPYEQLIWIAATVLAQHAGFLFRSPKLPDRAILIVDGSSWYHPLKGIGIASPERLDYAKFSQKLVGPRAWVATRYPSPSSDRDFSSAIEATPPAAFLVRRRCAAPDNHSHRFSLKLAGATK